MAAGTGEWFRRRAPRLSGTLHIRDTNGRELVVPLRGRAFLLTAGGTGLRGHGEVWAVRTTSASTETSLMIVYGRNEPAGERRSGLCPAGRTVTLDDVDFTWRTSSAPPPARRIPQPRTASAKVPRNLRMPAARGTNTRAEPIPAGGLRGRLRNMVRVVTQAARD